MFKMAASMSAIYRYFQELFLDFIARPRPCHSTFRICVYILRTWCSLSFCRVALSLGRYQGIDDAKNITLGDELADNRFHSVEVRHNGRETWVILDRYSTGEKHRRIETRYKELHLDDFFFIGGAHDFTRLRDIISGANFKGCLKGVAFNKWNLLQALGGDATTLRKYQVKNNCPPFVDYIPFTLSGKASEFTFSGISTSGNSLKGSFKFRTYKRSGTILRQPISGGKGFELKYNSEAVSLSAYIKSSPTTVSVRQIFKYRGVDKGMWHEASFEVSAARISLTVNNINDLRPPGSDFPSSYFTGNVLIGGSDFIGCLWDLKLNDKKFDVKTVSNANIQTGVCNITDFCFPNSCKNKGKCSQDGKSFACDCYGTDYIGAVCQHPKYPRTCYDLRLEFPEMETGNYTIDPDGPGPEKPYQTICNITTELDWFDDEIPRIWTEVKSKDLNVLLQKYPPEEGAKPESVIRDIIYLPSFESAQTVALASEYCRQFIEYLCTNSKLLNKLSPSYGHWVGSHGRHNYYWGGSGPDQPGKCACGVRGDCIGGGNYWCNCDASRDTLESDEGYLIGTNGLTLPISQVLFGDVNIDQDHYANYTVGSLLCYGRPNNTATFTREDGIIALRYREGTLDGDNGYVSLFFRTPYDRGILFHQGDKTKNTRDFIRVAITGNDSVTLSFDIGNGAQYLTVRVTENELNTNRLWHRVEVWFNIKEFGLQVDKVKKKVLNPLQSSKQLDVVGHLYIGGYMRELMQGFVGCMRGLQTTFYFYSTDIKWTSDKPLLNWGATFREKESYLTYKWPVEQRDAVGTDIAVGFETKQCSGTIMRMNGVDERDYFSISIDTKNKLRFAYSFSHPGIKLEEDALMIDSKLADGKSFCNGKKHSFSIERMYDKVVYKVDGGKEIRQDVPKLSVRFKKPKEVIIGSTGRGRFEGCISGVKVTNWPTRKVKAGTVEPIKWALYDFSHSKDLKAFGVARQKCGPEPEVPPIPTRPIPGPHGPTTPPPGPPGGPEKGKRKIDDEYTAIIVIIVLLIILVIIAVLALIYWYYAKHKGVYHTHEDEDQGKASEPFIDLQPLPAASSAPEEPQRKQEWFI
ncbi:hypothetical protein QZH41_009047 [Actinostola sp. cb2023]|nr:hypothetical protein QZH41_009047 [Actinostola sp. cb2023]